MIKSWIYGNSIHTNFSIHFSEIVICHKCYQTQKLPKNKTEVPKYFITGHWPGMPSCATAHTSISGLQIT